MRNERYVNRNRLAPLLRIIYAIKYMGDQKSGRIHASPQAE